MAFNVLKHSKYTLLRMYKYIAIFISYFEVIEYFSLGDIIEGIVRREFFHHSFIIHTPTRVHVRFL